MNLYHGTSESIARICMEEGIHPRSETGSKGNWEHSVNSNPSNVYLTTAYAGYFARHTVGETDERWAIIEVDTARIEDHMFMPDEDFLEQVSRNNEWPEDLFYNGIRAAKGMIERTEWFRENLEDFSHMWEKSVEMMGNCCHFEDISPDAITRVSFFEPMSNDMIRHTALDPEISVRNYQSCEEKYRSLVQWFMGEDVSPEEFFGTAWIIYSETERQTMIAELAKRDGLEVIRLRENYQSEDEE